MKARLRRILARGQDRFTRAGLGLAAPRAPWWLVIEHPHAIARAQSRPLGLVPDRTVRFVNRAGGVPPRWRGDAPEIVFLQSRWDVPDDAIVDDIRAVKRAAPDCRVVFLDWYAPLDIRHPAVLEKADLYVKKQTFADNAAYARGYIDTNLVEFECAYNPSFSEPYRLGISRELVDAKLHTGWNFGMDPYLIRMLDGNDTPDHHERAYDVQLRIPRSEGDSPWYRHMRERCLTAARQCATPRSVISTSRVRYRDYLAELRNARICVSPFGYGEVCWRDFEAVANGCVLVKPRMGHLKTWPNIYRDNESFVAVDWKYEELAKRLCWLVENPEDCQAIARRAGEHWRTYVETGFFSDLERLKRRLECP